MKLHRFRVEEPDKPGHTLWFFWCPGCRHCHSYLTEATDRPNWTFNGDLDRPTFSPSLRVYTTHPETRVETTLCHLHVTDGELRYCGDCVHDHNGKVVPMCDIPANYGLPGLKTE